MEPRIRVPSIVISPIALTPFIQGVPGDPMISQIEPQPPRLPNPLPVFLLHSENQSTQHPLQFGRIICGYKNAQYIEPSPHALLSITSAATPIQHLTDVVNVNSGSSTPRGADFAIGQRYIARSSVRELSGMRWQARSYPMALWNVRCARLRY